MPPRLSTPSGQPRLLRLRLAHLGSIDAAPLLVAQERGFFAQEGLDVQLRRELGVAALTAKLSDEQLEGACLPAHYPVLLSLGLGGPRVAMEAVLVCSYQDLAIVLANRNGASKPSASPEPALKLGLLTPGSAGRLIAQRWWQTDFAAARIEPTFLPLAASQLVNFLREGAIDGFCGIEPAPALAVASGHGMVVVRSGRLFPQHPGGAVALRHEWAEANPNAADALRRALVRARQLCADPAHADEAWKLVLAQSAHEEGAEQRGAATLAATAEHRPDMRFDGPAKGTGVDAAGALFLEQACLAACGETVRGIDFKSAIARVYDLDADKLGGARA